MDKHMSTVNQAIGLFYVAGLTIAAGAFLFLGSSTGKWAETFFVSLGGGIGFGLLMHAIVTLLAALRDKDVG
jgi:hypothetical protein